jgi:arabinofuranosyltransferase
VAYLLYVGADFMEFRFLVPILPIAAVLTTGAVAHLPHRRQLAAVAVLLIGSAAKWVFFPGLLGIESARGLKGHVTAEGGWLEMGEVLRDAWPQGEHGGPTIAATPAGAIPYASRLRTIDMLGLTDVDANDEANRWELTKLKAGHEHIATVDYLESRHVDLIVGLERDCGELAEGDPIEVVRELYLTYRVERDDLPDGARLVEIPLRTAKRCMVVVQISKRPIVNRVVDARGWATRDI